MGGGRALARPSETYIQLSLRDPEVTRSHWVKCLRATADFYGWTANLPLWQPKGYWSEGRFLTYGQNFNAAGANRGGKRLAICRSSSTRGTPAGMTNVFRISRHVTESDLARLAAATTAEWEWMETRFHERRRKDRWLAIAASAKI